MEGCVVNDEHSDHEPSENLLAGGRILGGVTWIRPEGLN
jgi:hypothetical protein